MLVIDNYDSFVYNIAQLLGELKTEPTVVRNDKLSLQDIKKLDSDAIVISPGPGHPADRKYFGVCTDVITELGPRTP
ncbi:MAG: aminodeoxychorismate/anthranilate synthase component II, partial [Nitrososphaera sp.]|nr:aminodeoxychorismate/anthranilate synthase component II [Nitrososphaera sp.]